MLFLFSISLVLQHAFSSNCELGYGIDKRKNSETKGECILCQSYSCIRCSDNAEICTECFFGDLDTNKKSKTYGKCTKPCKNFHCLECEGNKCLKCDISYGVDEDGKCKKCTDENCFRCSKNYKICETCGLYQHEYGVDLDKSSETYGKCVHSKIENCEEISNDDASKCTKCKNGFYLNNGKCNKCEIEYCSKCSNSTRCTSCVDNYYLNNGKCIECANKNCKKCDNDKCYECKNGFYLNDDYQCINTTIENCEELDEYNNSRCSYCNSNYGYDSESNLCVKCKDPNCISCSRNYKICKNCISDVFYIDPYSGTCVKDCANSRCLKCNTFDNSECLICEETLDILQMM